MLSSKFLHLSRVLAVTGFKIGSISTTIRAGTVTLRFAAQVVLSIAAASVLMTTVAAAPLTFQFSAVVADDTDLPFVVSQGDVIHGSFSFEPGSSSGNYPQIGGLLFDIAGVSLSAQEYEVLVQNDQQRWIDVAGRIADPNNTPDVDFNATGDSIVLMCQGSGASYCGVVDGYSNYVVRPLLAFSDEPSLISSTDLTGDVSVWNAFSLRELSLIFKNVDTGELAYVGAYISQIQQVPEPCLLQTVPMMFCMLVAFARVRNRHAPLRSFRS
jgi:hypothetical protein